MRVTTVSGSDGRSWIGSRLEGLLSGGLDSEERGAQYGCWLVGSQRLMKWQPVVALYVGCGPVQRRSVPFGVQIHDIPRRMTWQSASRGVSV